MSEYKVIETFVDLQDGNYRYNVGDKFPHDGIEVSEKRINDLSGKNNRRKRALIEKIDVADNAADEAVEVANEVADEITEAIADVDEVEIMNEPELADVAEPVVEEVKTARKGKKSQK